MEYSDISVLAQKLKENIARVIVGKEKQIDLILTALLSGGHILLEDVPGTGKTTLAKSLAKSLSCDFSRVQFTPDLLPSDITGTRIYNQHEGNFTFVKGPAFTNVLLADEINRATPKTQAAGRPVPVRFSVWLLWMVRWMYITALKWQMYALNRWI